MSAPDLTEFYKLSKPKKPPCQVGLILAGEISPKLDAELREQLDAACKADKGIITAGAIQGWLDARGHNVNINRISNHRRKTCTCHDD